MAARVGEGRNDYNISLARAQRRQVEEAVARLLEAENTTPEQIRNHRVVRQLVSDLLSMQIPASAELRELADRVGC
ncbi:hypothetical protein [Nonomuraea insulae]|uniref:Uncharacterized protein n=1 Tax=Nonomuraea insulae TaxID=1616787 RepID=A0ABW1CMJ9_9ACTN